MSRVGFCCCYCCYLVQGQYQTTEAHKQNLVREGMLSIAEANMAMARKCLIVFEAVGVRIGISCRTFEHHTRKMSFG